VISILGVIYQNIRQFKPDLLELKCLQNRFKCSKLTIEVVRIQVVRTQVVRIQVVKTQVVRIQVVRVDYLGIRLVSMDL
jgi:hypothetical protein